MILIPRIQMIMMVEVVLVKEINGIFDVVDTCLN